ncbi:MAG: SRPBCC family protein [Bacteroidota bacterium]
MPVITLETFIAADREIVFDLARSIDLHQLSLAHTREEAIAGVTSGLIGPGEEVTWRATHFGVRQTLSSKITEFERPCFFSDEMLKGAFKCFKHRHDFLPQTGGTTLLDTFDFEAPLGWLGHLANRLFLKRYMTNFLVKRNQVLKAYAESDKWREIL